MSRTDELDDKMFTIAEVEVSDARDEAQIEKMDEMSEKFFTPAEKRKILRAALKRYARKRPEGYEVNPKLYNNGIPIAKMIRVIKYAYATNFGISSIEGEPLYRKYDKERLLYYLQEKQIDITLFGKDDSDTILTHDSLLSVWAKNFLKKLGGDFENKELVERLMAHTRKLYRVDENLVIHEDEEEGDEEE